MISLLSLSCNFSQQSTSGWKQAQERRMCFFWQQCNLRTHQPAPQALPCRSLRASASLTDDCHHLLFAISLYLFLAPAAVGSITHCTASGCQEGRPPLTCCQYQTSVHWQGWGKGQRRRRAPGGAGVCSCWSQNAGKTATSILCSKVVLQPSTRLVRAFCSLRTTSFSPCHFLYCHCSSCPLPATHSFSGHCSAPLWAARTHLRANNCPKHAEWLHTRMRGNGNTQQGGERHESRTTRLSPFASLLLFRCFIYGI